MPEMLSRHKYRLWIDRKWSVSKELPLPVPLDSTPGVAEAGRWAYPKSKSRLTQRRPARIGVNL